MKKSIKLTLGLLGISAISAITVGSVISCSNDSSMVSTNSNNSSNSNNTNKSNTSNKENTTNFIPYSELTKTVTKEPSFGAALTAWTNDWKKLTANPETYLNLITNDVNACLSYSSKLVNANPTWISKIANIKNIAIEQSYKNVDVLLNKNNTFNISFTLIANFGYIQNDKFSSGFSFIYNINFLNSTFKPYLFQLQNINSSNQIVYGGEFMNSFNFNAKASISKLSSSMPKNNATTWVQKQYNGSVMDLQTFNKKFYSNNFYNVKKPINIDYPDINYQSVNNPLTISLFVNSYNYGINFGKQIYPNLNN
ncbi:MAG: hypothetical protein IIT78_03310 [Mycoplasmataceae bacterium]|nr:hypothetical protein [Mycoplasmataceae bacterium]